MVFLALLFASLCVSWDPRDVFIEEKIDPSKLKDEVEEMVHHAFDSYRNYAGFENDELRPLSCKGHNKMGGLSTTLIDSLDMLAVLRDRQGFTEGVDWVLEHIKNFDLDSNVSVFETNIRILGGLLSAHIIASNSTLQMYLGTYNGGLLQLAVDLADRLLWAFDTPSHLPFGTVNLRRGVPIGESRIVCAACAATFSLEFGLLSALTGNPRYETTAKEAVDVLWSKRSMKSGLLGTHLEIDHGSWVLSTTAGLGGDIDSAYEYFYKAGVAFGDERYLMMFNMSLEAIQKTLRVEGDDYLYFVDSDLITGIKTLSLRSLSAFWPGILAHVGLHSDAKKTIQSLARVIELLGFLPESLCVTSLPNGAKVVSDLSVQPFQRGLPMDGYPLRPEFVESLFHLFSVTKDRSLLQHALRVQQALRKTRVTCGFCSVHGVLNQQHNLLDQMDSFVVSETLKYLYLLWDLAEDNPEKNWVNKGGYIFTTEAHIFPLETMLKATPTKIVEKLIE